jgi:NTE family protein
LTASTVDRPLEDLVREPISAIDQNTETTKIAPGIALCLSGGGYRAMTFHLGSLIRLNEVGLLMRLNRVSSVSGGSITSAQLGLKWGELIFENGVAKNLNELVIEPIRMLGQRTIDRGSIIRGILNPCQTISDYITRAYSKNLFGGATLQDLPSNDRGPRFVINSTNVQTGALWRFSKPYMGDYKVGRVLSPLTLLATAVAASSAFPPVLSPVLLDLTASEFAPDPNAILQRRPFTTHVYLTDGGVYDNLGLETAFKGYKTLLVSDGGGKMAPQDKPARDWVRHALRINNVIDNQVRSLRKRQLIAEFQRGEEHDGTYWGIRSHLNDYPVTTSLACPQERTEELAATPTRLRAMKPAYQERLINWGYAVCAAAVESYLKDLIAAPTRFPFASGV